MIKAGASIKTGLVLTAAAKELTVGATVTSWADTHMSFVTVGAHSSVLARAVLAEVSLGLTVPAHESRFADTVVAVDKLDAFLSSAWRAGTGQAFIDVTLAPWPNVTRSAFAFIASDLVDTSTSVMASSIETFIDIDLTKYTKGSMRA